MPRYKARDASNFTDSAVTEAKSHFHAPFCAKRKEFFNSSAPGVLAELSVCRCMVTTCAIAMQAKFVVVRGDSGSLRCRHGRYASRARRSAQSDRDGTWRPPERDTLAWQAILVAHKYRRKEEIVARELFADAPDRCREPGRWDQRETPWTTMRGGNSASGGAEVGS
jgi:hypothetical protein